MPVYLLPDEAIFPDIKLAEPDGLLAIGGDLSIERLLQAYAQGIFPWYSEGQEILWWSPNPRMLLFPQDFRRSKNLTRTVQSGDFHVEFDENFEAVIMNCSQVSRKAQDGTWITDDMKDAYVRLHEAGYAHSVETYREGKLVGGLYGVSLGGVFFGESMFHIVRDASKFSLWHLVDRACEWNFDFIDVQQDTTHLRSLGADTVDREKFLFLLKESLMKPTQRGIWASKI